MTTGDLIQVYKEAPTVKLAQYISKYISAFSNKEEFLTMDKDLLYQILDQCEVMNPDDVKKLLLRISEKQEIDVEEFLMHIETNRAEVLKAFPSDSFYMYDESSKKHDPFVYSKMGQYNSTFAELKKMIADQNNKTEVLMKKFYDLETRLTNHIADVKSHSLNQKLNDVECDNFILIKNLQDCYDMQQKAISKLEKSVNFQISRKVGKLKSDYDEMRDQLQNLSKNIDRKSSPHIPSNISTSSIFSLPLSTSFEGDKMNDVKHHFTSCSSKVKKLSSGSETYFTPNIKSPYKDKKEIDSMKTRFETPKNNSICDNHTLDYSFESIPLENNTSQLVMSQDSADSNLHMACREGYIDMCENLIRNGADVNGRNKDGKTPLHLAADRGLDNICELLIFNGADLDVSDKDINHIIKERLLFTLLLQPVIKIYV